MSTIDALSHKQLQSIGQATARVNVWEGAVRSGKTIGSILKWFMFVANPPAGGALVMVGRTRESLARNVIDPMQDDTLFGDLADQVSYTPGAPSGTILGRKVYVMGASDVKSEKTLRGLTVVGAYVDEITVIMPEFFKQLLARMSPPGAQLFGTTNPDSPAHWLKVEFLDRIGPGERQLNDWRTWHFGLDDNPQLSESYKNSLKTEYTGLWYRRFINGEWVAADGAVFDMWDPAVHVVAWESLPQMIELIGIGVDYGTTNPTVAILIGLGVDNNLYAVDEWSYEAVESAQRWTDAELSKGIRGFVRRQHLPAHAGAREHFEEPVDLIFVDPSANNLAIQMRQDDMFARPADNDVSYGVRALASMLSRRRLLISDRCPRLIAEIPGYSWDTKATEEGFDKPIKVADHAIDALRYVCVSTETRWRPTVDSTTSGPEITYAHS